MKGKKIKALLAISLISLFSCQGNTSSETKNTIGLKYYLYDDSTCSVGALVGFNCEEIIIPNYYQAKNGKTYKVTGINANQRNNDKTICQDFLKANKYIKKVVFEAESIEGSLPWDLFRDSSVEFVDFSLAKGIKGFGDHLFTSSSLKEVILPPNLESTNVGCFSKTNLINVTFPASYKDMGIDTFFDCKYLESVDFNSSLTYISGSCFERTPKLKKVTGSNIQVVEQYAFQETPSLEEFDFENINTLGVNAFCKSGIKEAHFNNNVYLENKCFFESKIEKLSIKSSEFIGYKAFQDTPLKEVNISYVKKIRSSAFKNTLIESISLPASLITLESETFSNCKNLKNVELPLFIESISSNCFRKCTSLNEIVIPSTLKRVYDGAFLETGLKNVSLSKDVTMQGKPFEDKCIINYY